MAKELQKDSKLRSENESWEVRYGTIRMLDILSLVGQERVPADDVVRAAHFSFSKLGNFNLVCSKFGESFLRFLSTCRGFGDPTFKNPDPIVSISEYLRLWGIGTKVCHIFVESSQVIVTPDVKVVDLVRKWICSEREN